MAYGEIIRVRAPLDVYRALHRQVTDDLGTTVPEGAILHIARATEDGFEIIEVWDSKEQADAFTRDVFGPAAAKLGGGAGGPEPEVIEFEPTTAITFAEYSSERTQ